MASAGATRRFETAIVGGTYLTADRRRPILEDGALGLLDGRIARVFEAPDARAIQAARVIDGTGKVITPGFANVHTHAILSMVRGVAEDLGFAPAYTPGVPHGHDVTPDEAVALARLGALEAMLFGSTLINDTYVHADLTLPAMGELGLRVYACGRIHDVDFSQVHNKKWEHRAEIGAATLGDAVRLFEAWHGRMNGRLGVHLAAHAPDTCSRGLLVEVRKAAEALKLGVNTHLAQSKVEVQRIRERDQCTPAELLEDIGLLNERLLAAHCIYMSESDIARAGRAGIFVSHIAKGNATGGTMAPSSALRRAGARLALGTDNMHADMVEVMRWALNIGRLQEGAVTDFWQPADVFEMATRAGAAALGLDDQIGSIEEGKKADLVVFDFRRPHLVPATNPLGNLVHVAQGRDVDTVLVDGEIVVDGGRATKVDQDRIMAEAARAAAALWRRAKSA